MIAQRSNRELWSAFFAILLISLAYVLLVVWLGQIPGASGFFGHTIGIVGFLLMLMTEILYSLRKRSHSARWGRTSAWLSFHIFTGIVGPYMVLLHTSWKFNGLAGVVTLMTIIVVASGFIGRYIYTAVPRTVDGAEVEAGQLEEEIAAIQAELQTADRSQAKKLKQLTRRQNELRRQLSSLAMARRMLALWHAVHIPIGMALFVAAFVHAGAALYYATFLR
jgi:uncharacterized membrane protein (DUF106 family)